MRMTTKRWLTALWQPIERRLFSHYSSSADSNDLATLKDRDAKPSHCLLRIEAFNELSENIKAFDVVNDFEAGGYQWKLGIFPKGDEGNDGKNHISIYLEVLHATHLPVGWEINATFNFFIYDQFRNKYVGLQDARTRCFSSMKKRWCVPKFIDLKTFSNSSKGFLVNDTCIFGVEVFVTCAEECIKFIREPERICRYEWKLDKFTKKITNKWYKSDIFIGGDYKWRIFLNPDYDDTQSIAIGLDMDHSSLPCNTKLLTNYLIRLVDQNKKDQDLEISGTGMLCSSKYTDPSNYGDCILEQKMEGLREPNFASLAEVQDPKMGYLVNDTCIIEVEIDVLALTFLLSDNRFSY